MKKLITLLPLLGLLLDSNWLYLGPILNNDNLRHGGFISELSAHGQPYAGLFQTLDIIAGLVWVGAAFYLLRVKRSILSRLLGSVLLVLGTGDIVDALLPLDCSETLSGVCRQASLSSFTDNVHLVESCVAVILFAIVANVLLLSLHYSRKRRSLYFMTIFMLSAMLLWLFDTLARQHIQSEGYGYIQRWFQAIFIVWLTVFWRTVQKQPHLLSRLYVRPRLRRR